MRAVQAHFFCHACFRKAASQADKKARDVRSFTRLYERVVRNCSQYWWVSETCSKNFVNLIGLYGFRVGWILFCRGTRALFTTKHNVVLRLCVTCCEVCTTLSNPYFFLRLSRLGAANLMDVLADSGGSTLTVIFYKLNISSERSTVFWK